MFNATRLRIARQRAGLTKKELGLRIGVDPRTVSGYEADQYAPSEETLDRIVSVLDFPRSFFDSDDIDTIDPGGVSFRSMTKMTAKQRDAAISAGSIALLLSSWADSQFDLPESDLPDLSGADPEIAADSLRRLWQLGEKPIKNIIHLLESRGVRLFSLMENCVEVDAYSLWHEARPFVFLNTMKSAERRRFDAAHELGHLVLHRHAAPNGNDAEREANAFASAFLMPRASMRALGRIPPNLPSIIALKKNWLVSTAAMTMRLHHVGLLKYHQYQSLFMEISRMGYRTREPEEMQPERSQVWEKIFAALRSEGHGAGHLSNLLSVPQAEVERLVFGLVTLGVPVNEDVIPSRAKGAHLRLVE